MTTSDEAKELARKLWRKNWTGKISERRMAEIEKEQDDDDNRESVDRGQQGVRSEGDGTGNVGYSDNSQAGVVHDQGNPRRSSGGSEGNRGFFDMTQEEMRRWLEKHGDDPPACPHGIMAGPCFVCLGAER